MSDDAGAEERRRRAQARKDKIASRGADRLAQITGAAKGEGGASERFGTGGSTPTSRPTTPSASDSIPKRTETEAPRQAVPTVSLSNDDDDPPEIDLASLRQPQPPRGFEGFPAFDGFSNNASQNGNDPFGAGAGGMPDMLSALLGGGGAGGAGGGLPEQFASMFGGAGAGGPPGQQQQQTPFFMQPPRKKTWTDRLLPLVHLISMVALALYAVFVLEPRARAGYSALSAFSSGDSWWNKVGNVDWHGWAALGRGRQALEDSSYVAKGVEKGWQGLGLGVSGVQLVYLFFTLELFLQSFALLLLKTKPPIPGLLNTILPYLPPNLAMYAHTGIKYWAMLGQVLDDLAVLVLTIVSVILYAEWSVVGGDDGVGKIKID